MGIFKKLNNVVTDKAIDTTIAVKESEKALAEKIKNKLAQSNGNWLDESFKYILAVVIGLAFIAGLYALTKDTILPTLTEKVKEAFNFK